MRLVSFSAFTKSSLCISILLTLSVPAQAASVSVIGENGISGTNGTILFPNGGDGSTALFTTAAAESADTYNSAGATGGVGGAGGKAANTGTGGSGGNGGDAFSTATTNTSAPGGGVYSSSGANGGAGGVGGGLLGTTGTGGHGGNGGNATAGSASIDHGLGTVTVSADSVGGAGGSASSGGTAGNGGTATLGTVFGSSATGSSVSVSGRAFGGSGGSATGLANGGNGSDVSLINAVDGYTTGILTLLQSATGGHTGNTENGLSGIAGNGYSALAKSGNFEQLNLTSEASGGVGRYKFGVSGSVAASGGNATAEVSGRNDSGGATATVSAIGGSGGYGLAQSNGGAGGNATASANIAASGSVNVEVTVKGGEGGSGLDPSGILRPGGNGGLASLGLISGISTGGNSVNVSASAFGGNGAQNSGQGASVFLDNAVAGSTTGALTLQQNAYAGSSTGVSIAGTSPTAGNAFSNLSKTTSASILDLSTIAIAGGGSRASSLMPAGNGGMATAITRATNEAGEAVARTNARGGGGGYGERGSATGNGGGASSTAFASSTGTGNSASAFGNAVGGAGGYFGIVGTGGHATSQSTATAMDDGWVHVSDYALGGAGSSSSAPFGGDGGNGGSASSSAYGKNNGAGEVLVVASATGGDGGSVAFGTTGGTRGRAGDANANSIAFGGGVTSAIAHAASPDGAAMANANATSTGGPAYARATSITYDSSSSLHSTADAATVQSAGLSVHAHADGIHTVTASTNIGNTATSMLPLEPGGPGAQAVALPSAALAESALADNSTVRSVFNAGGGGTMLGLASFSMEGDLTDTPGLQTTSVDFHMDMSSAGPQNNLVVGLLGSGGWYNNGFQSLNFQASVEGVTVIDISFADLISADNYFSDKTLFLGDWTQLISNDNILDLAFLVSMTGQWGDSFSTNLIVGTTMTETGNPVPLPPALWLLISGLLGVFSFGCKRKDKGTGD